MKIYILSDMEGISGIRKIEQTDPASPEYPEGRNLMMADMNAAIEGAFQGGATEVFACDWHAGGGQYRLAEMDSRAIYDAPNGRSMRAPSLDASFDGLVLLGLHAMAGAMNAFLDHTINSREWFEYRINGRTVGEAAIEAAYAAHYDVPVIAATGDEAACVEAKEFFGEVETATVKWAAGRNRATCLSLPEAHARVTSAVRTAVQNIGKYKPWKPTLPATIRLTVFRSDMADIIAREPQVKRIDARTLDRTVDSLLHVQPW